MGGERVSLRIALGEVEALRQEWDLWEDRMAVGVMVTRGRFWILLAYC